jgi:putative ABC transport system permease protein
MYAILRQVKANLRYGRLQSVLILLTLLAATTLLTLALLTFHTASGAYNRLFERSHGAHVWIYLDPRKVTAEQSEQQLADLLGVEATTGVIRSFSRRLYVGGEATLGQELREWPAEAIVVARPILVAGRVPERGERDVIVLDRNVAAYYGLNVGDTVDLLAPDGHHLLTVVGLQVNSIHCPFPYCQPARDYVASGMLADLETWLSPTPDMETLAVGLRLSEPPDMEAAIQAAEEALPPGALFSWWDWSEVRRHCDETVRLQRIILIAFSLVAGLAAGLLMANVVGGAVRAQTRQIGLLKAVGFTGRQLALVYLSESLGLALLASLAGLLLGGLLASMILGPIALRFGETLVRPPLWVTLAAPLVTLLVTMLFTLGPVRRAARLDVVQAIRVGSEAPRRRAGRMRWLPISPALGLGEAFSHPLRSVLTALGLGVTMVALTFALTAVHTLQAFERDPSLGGMRDGDLIAFPSQEVSGAELRRLIADQTDVAASYGELETAFQFPGEEEILQAHFREGDLAAFRFPLIEGRMPAAADEAVVSYVLSRERDLRAGDTMTILLEGEPVMLQVVGLYREGLALGRMLILSTDLLRRFKPTVESTRYLLKVRPEADAQAVSAALKAASGGALQIGEIELSEALTSLPRALAWLSVMLGGLAAVGAFNTAWMGVQERKREFGMLKAAGMTPRQVALSVLAGMAALALAGYALGTCVGLPGVHLLFDLLGRAMGFGPLDASVDVLGQVLLLPAIVLLAALAALLPAWRAGRTSVVEVLRHE